MKKGQKTRKKLEFWLKNKEKRQKAGLKSCFGALIETNRDESAFLGRRAGRRVSVSKSGLSRSAIGRQSCFFFFFFFLLSIAQRIGSWPPPSHMKVLSFVRDVRTFEMTPKIALEWETVCACAFFFLFAQTYEDTHSQTSSAAKNKNVLIDKESFIQKSNLSNKELEKDNEKTNDKTPYHRHSLLCWKMTTMAVVQGG